MLTKEQVELLNGMCLGAHEVELGTLLLQLQQKGEEMNKVVWYNFNGTSTEEN
jgi:hypothetical protein